MWTVGGTKDGKGPKWRQFPWGEVMRAEGFLRRLVTLFLALALGETRPTTRQ